MNENKKTKREWVKTAAIIFLSVMLVLTFFSNTIMNYSLPEVAAQYIQSGSITTKIRGTGVVESGSVYNVKVMDSRKVMGVEVRVGDKVAVGDVICYLEEGDSTELEVAKAELKNAEAAYETALLSGDLNASVLQNAGSTESTESYRKKMLAAQNEVTAAQTEVDAAQKLVDDLQKQSEALDVQISITPSNSANTATETQAVNTAKINKNNATVTLAQAESAAATAAADLQYAQTVSSGDAGLIAELTARKTAADNAVTAAQKALENAELELQKAETALENKITAGDTSATIANLQSQKTIVQANLFAANNTLTEKQKILTQKQKELADLTANINASLNLGVLSDAVEAAREKVAEIEAGTGDTVIVAEVAGTITAVNVIAGEKTAADSVVATILPEGKGYTLSFSVTAEQAKRISVGDPAELVNAWWYDDVTASVVSIKPDPSNPSRQKLVTFALEGELSEGQSLSLQVGARSANYDMIVPNSAIREDNNGKFVLVIESKSSPLGNRYFANRYDVEVLASDDTRSAISGALNGYEFVLTTSTKPVEAGKQVRLPD